MVHDLRGRVNASEYIMGDSLVKVSLLGNDTGNVGGEWVIPVDTPHPLLDTRGKLA